MPFLFMLLLLGVGTAIYLRQRFSFGSRTVIGSRARTVGCLLMLPLPLSFMLLICWLTSMVGDYESVEAMQRAILTDPSVLNTSMIIELIAIISCVGLATWLIFSGNANEAAMVTANGTSVMSGQALTLRQAAGFSHLTESQLMMLIRAEAIPVQRAVDGYRIDPKALELWMYMERGVSQYNRRAYVEAIQDFTRALNVDHKASDAYAWRGLAFLRAGRESDGLQDMRYALAHTQEPEKRRKLTQWLTAPNTAPMQIAGRNQTLERVVSDWLAGADTVEQTAEQATMLVQGEATAYTAPPEDDNETLKS